MAAVVFINGKRDEIETPANLASFLEGKRIRPEVATIMLNGSAVKRDALADTTAQDGDTVEIMIQLAGGR